MGLYHNKGKSKRKKIEIAETTKNKIYMTLILDTERRKL